LELDGVQLGTRFIGTFECDASDKFKKVILDAKEEDINSLNLPSATLQEVVKAISIN